MSALEGEIAIPEGTVVLEKYQVERMLGAGEVGRVFKAVHTSLGSHVAIKVLLPHQLVSETTARRFAREAKAASRISSEHIVRLFDTGTSHPYGPYCVMEYMEGGDLGQRLEQAGPLTIHAAIDAVVQASLALAEAHASGLVHYGVKPSNLLIAGAGKSDVIKMVDFGIGKVVEHPTLAGGAYWSPERMRRDAVDHRADIYGLGVTLFQLLTGSLPFTFESIEELKSKVKDEAPLGLRELRRDAPADLSAAVELAYAKNPEERYQTVGELAAALAPWASPRTLLSIEALARREMRRSIGSLPRSQDQTNPPPSLRSLSARPPTNIVTPEPTRPVVPPTTDQDNAAGGGPVMLVVAIVLVVVIAGGLVLAFLS